MMKKHIAFRPPPEIELILRRHCVQKRMMMSEALRRALYEYLQRRNLIEGDPARSPATPPPLLGARKNMQ
jgi:hypothetical protein